jgi:TPR repeat protein
MGTFYMTGDGLPPGEVQDGLKAAEYYEKAANLGFMAAALNWGKTANKPDFIEGVNVICLLCVAMMMVEGIPPLQQDLYAGRDILRRYQHLHADVRTHLQSLEWDIQDLEQRGLLKPPVPLTSA